MTTYVYDIESYPNYFLCVFKPLGEQRYEHFTHQDLDGLIEFLDRPDLTLVGYNNHKFDDVILKLIAGEQASSPQAIFRFVTLLIDGEKPEGILKKALYLDTPWRSIDLLQIMGQGAGSLKVNQVRLKWKNVQELPIPPGTVLSEEQKTIVFDYCCNDVASTEALYHAFNAKRLLAVGCGLGDKLLHYKQLLPIRSAVGFDINERYIELARAHALKKGFSEELVRFERADCARMPCEDGVVTVKAAGACPGGPQGVARVCIPATTAQWPHGRRASCMVQAVIA